VIITSFHNHMYGITQSWKKKKRWVLQKKKKVTIVVYVKKMQSITYPITLTYLQLKVAKITLERLTLSRMAYMGGGG
jgi:hypothetical protein